MTKRRKVEHNTFDQRLALLELAVFFILVLYSMLVKTVKETNASE